MNGVVRVQDWADDISVSVSQYDAWYSSNAPQIYVEARRKAADLVSSVLEMSGQLTGISAGLIVEQPAVLTVLRLAAAPPMARDRVVTMAGVRRSLLESLERGKPVPLTTAVGADLERARDFLLPLIDPLISTWLEGGPREREWARVVLADRLARAHADPEIRNAQERRQKVLLRAFLLSRHYSEASGKSPLEAGTFAIGHVVRVATLTGALQMLPMDCVVSRRSDGRLVCIEMKSAGDFTNPNKRRKEEADKYAALQRTYGGRASLVLQLFGYFNRAYLTYESGAGINWAWDHRLEDLDRFI